MASAKKDEAPEWMIGTIFVLLFYAVVLIWSLLTIGGMDGFRVGILIPSILCGTVVIAWYWHCIDDDFPLKWWGAFMIFLLLGISSASPYILDGIVQIEHKIAIQSNFQMANPPIHYVGNVTQAKIWKVTSCAWYGGCSPVPNENITITLPSGVKLSRHYTCDYFVVGQSVKVIGTPIIGYNSTMTNPIVIPAPPPLPTVIGMIYAVQDVPSGC